MNQSTRNNIGSFYIVEKQTSLGSLFTVKYQEEHNVSISWQFLKDKEKAIAFAKKKTSIDRKLNGSQKHE